MEELKKKIAADLKDMFAECEHGNVKPHELEEEINGFMSDCRDDFAAGNLTDREMDSLVRMVAREAEKLNITVKLD